MTPEGVIGLNRVDHPPTPSADDASPSPTLSSRVVWGKLRGDQITQEINDAYREVIRWKPNLFKVPSGQTGDKFIDELTRTAEFFKHDSHLEPIALTALITMMPLLLQKPTKTSKTSDHVKYLKDRLELWKSGNLTKLIRQGKEIQKPLLQTDKPPPVSSDKVTKTFTRLMLQGKISSAVKWISNQSCGVGVHKVTDAILKDLEDKHPDAREPSPDALLQGPVMDVEPVAFERINGNAIYRAALHCKGSGGPSGANADCWKRVLCGKGFKSHSKRLCDAIANIGKRMCTENIEPQHLQAFNASRLIPLDNKNMRQFGVAHEI